jgi:hypothetical protein
MGLVPWGCNFQWLSFVPGDEGTKAGMEQYSHGPLGLRITLFWIQMLRERSSWSLVLWDIQDRRKRLICWNRQSDQSQSSVCWVHLCMRKRLRIKCHPVCFLCPGSCLNSTGFPEHGDPWMCHFWWENTHQDPWVSSGSGSGDHSRVISVSMNDTLAFVHVRMCPSVKINVFISA